MSVAEKLTVIAENEQRVYGAGKQAEYDRFWNAFQNKGSRGAYAYAFMDWDETAFYPKYDIKMKYINGADGLYPAVSAFRRFSKNGNAVDLAKRLEDCGVKLDTSEVNAFSYTFSFCNATRLPEIDMSSATNAYMAFYAMTNLKTIDEIVLDNETGFSLASNVFYGCSNLENITITGKIVKEANFKDCIKLTKDSIESVVNAIAESEAVTLTLSQTAVDNAFEGGSEGTEWAELIALRPNCTISLV